MDPDQQKDDKHHYQGYRLNFFLQELAGPLKQYDWGPSQKVMGLGFSGQLNSITIAKHWLCETLKISIALIIYDIHVLTVVRIS